MRPALSYPRAILLILISLATVAAEIRAQNTLIPLTTRRDMVFDHTGKYLYISTSDGFVQRYNLTTNQIDNSYNLGGSLNGLDIAPDDSFLLVAQGQLENSQGKFQKLNLTTGAVTNIAYSPATAGEAGGYSVTIAANGIALVTTARQSGTSGGNSFPLRVIDLASNTISIRQDVTGLGDSTWFDRSADGLLIYSLLGNGLLSYSSDNDHFTTVSVAPGSASTAVAVNRDRSLFARVSPWYGASIDTAANLTFIHNFGGV